MNNIRKEGSIKVELYPENQLGVEPTPIGNIHNEAMQGIDEGIQYLFVDGNVPTREDIFNVIKKVGIQPLLRYTDLPSQKQVELSFSDGRVVTVIELGFHAGRRVVINGVYHDTQSLNDSKMIISAVNDLTDAIYENVKPGDEVKVSLVTYTKIRTT